MKRLITLALLVLSLTSMAKTWATKEDQIKGCMMIIYANQSAFHLKNHIFTKTIEDLNLSQSEDCKDIDVKLIKASSKVFEAEVITPNSTWTIDSKKNMKKIK